MSCTVPGAAANTSSFVASTPFSVFLAPPTTSTSISPCEQSAFTNRRSPFVKDSRRVVSSPSPVSAAKPSRRSDAKPIAPLSYMPFSGELCPTRDVLFVLPANAP